MLLRKSTRGANFGTNGKPVKCTFEGYLDCEKIFSTKSERKSKNRLLQLIRVNRLKYMTDIFGAPGIDD